MIDCWKNSQNDVWKNLTLEENLQPNLDDVPQQPVFFSRRQYIIKRKSNSFKSNSLKVLFATGEKCLKCLRIISMGGPKKRKKKKPLIVIIPLNKFSCNFA